MKKVYLLFFISLYVFTNLEAQSGKWTWIRGENNSNLSPTGNYGTMGVASPTNDPPPRYQAAYWTDLDGNFWLFGGQGTGSTFNTLNDLWKYDISTNMWTWMSGSQYGANMNGVYGTKGVPSVNNYPSARGYGANSWTDLNNNLWLYGGTGSSDDLWKYNIATNEWTWVFGTDPLVSITSVNWGTIGVNSLSNTPGTRQEIKSGWVDKNNDLWMFGGYISDLFNFGVVSDTWKYNIASNSWTCMGGDNTLNSLGNYGTLGVDASTNLPPARWSYTKWKDRNGKFYIFAGGSFDSYNDCWRFDPSTNNWTWISGTNTTLDSGTYTQQCNPNKNNFPHSRLENQTVATTGCSEAFWSFGGCESFGYKVFNDLWLYNSSDNKWTWVSGSNTPDQIGNYGTKGVYSSTNMIPSKFGLCIWSDKQSNLWVFGGYTINTTGSYDGLNDLWKFEPDTSCFSANLSSSFSLGYPNDTLICYGEKVYFNIPSNKNFSINPNTGITVNSTNTQIIFSPNFTTTYTISATDDGSNCPGSDTIVYTLVVENNPDAKFTIYPKNTTLATPSFNFNNTSSNAVKYEWYYNGNLFSTQINPSISFSDTGQYCITLVAFNSQNCVDSFTDCGHIGPLIPPPPPAILEVPNSFSPNNDKLNDYFKVIYKNIQYFEFKIYDRWGEQVFTSANPETGWDGTINGRACDAGVYFYTVKCWDMSNNPISKKGDLTLIR